MKQSVKRLISSILSLLLVLGAFVVFFNFIQPVYSEVSELKGRVLGQGDLVAREQAVIREVQKLVAVYDQSSALRDSVSAALPQVPDLAGALTQLNGLAGLNHLTAQAYALSVPASVIPDEARRNPDRPGSGSLVRPVNSVIFQIKILGTYEDLKGFLKNLEANIRVMDVRSLNIQPGLGQQSGKTANLFQYDLTVAAYYQTGQTPTPL